MLHEENECETQGVERDAVCHIGELLPMLLAKYGIGDSEESAELAPSEVFTLVG